MVAGSHDATGTVTPRRPARPISSRISNTGAVLKYPKKTLPGLGSKKKTATPLREVAGLEITDRSIERVGFYFDLAACIYLASGTFSGFDIDNIYGISL